MANIITTKFQTNKRGFTLVEFVIYVGIVALMITSLSSFLIMAVSARTKAEAVANVEEQGIAAMQRITQTIRNATSITAPSIGTSSATGATVVVPTGALSPTLFNLSSGVLQMKEGAGAYVDLTSSQVVVSGLTFYNVSRPSTSGSMKIQFTVSTPATSVAPHFTYSKTFNGTATLRP